MHPEARAIRSSNIKKAWPAITVAPAPVAYDLEGELLRNKLSPSQYLHAMITRHESASVTSCLDRLEQLTGIGETYVQH